ncbi:MAG: LapD/MoxY N-terminal periplasmic domain-containing protein, partial [Gammaproteobacteria bacterium]
MTLRKLLSIVTIIIFLIMFSGSWLMSMHNFRLFLQNSVQTQTVNTANALAFSLSEVGNIQNTEAQTMVDAIFETGNYHSILLLKSNNTLVFSRVHENSQITVPHWFQEAFPLDTKPASAMISKGWAQVGTVQVYPEISLAYQQLWENSKQLFFWFIGLLIITLIMEFITLHFILKPIDNITKQALDIINRKFTINEKLPHLKELRNIVTVMNRMTQRIQSVFEEQSNLIEQLREHAFQDSVTKLGNRRYFNLQTDDLLSQKEPKFIGSLYLLELKNLDILKLNQGYQIFELYLIQVAKVIKLVVEPFTGTVSVRLSDTTFGILIPNIDPIQSARIATILTEKLTYLQNMTSNHLSFHLGVAIYKAEQDHAQLMAEADKALRTAKQNGSNNYYLLEAEQAEKSHAGNFNQFKTLLDQNIAKKDYTVFFQPVMQISAKKSTITSFEALFRLKNQQNMYISAGEFMELADAHHLTKV